MYADGRFRTSKEPMALAPMRPRSERTRKVGRPIIGSWKEPGGSRNSAAFWDARTGQDHAGTRPRP